MSNLCSRLLALGLVTLALTGCPPSIPRDPEPAPRVSPILDAASGVIPLPNDLALDPDGTLPLVSESSEDAQASFASWFGALQGWPAATPISIPFDGALDPASLTPDNFKLYVLTQDAATSLPIAQVEQRDTPAGVTVLVTPQDLLVDGAAYGVIVTKGVQGANGRSIVEPVPIFFALNDGPIVTEDARVTIPQLESDFDQALQLEGLRKVLAPFISNVEVPRSEIAMAFTWGTSSQTSTILDPATATIPLPNTLALDPDGTFPRRALESLVAFDALGDEGADKSPQVFFDEYLDRLHGWPNTAGSVPITVPVTAAVDPESLTPESAQLWRLLPDGTAEVVTPTTARYLPEQGVVQIVPDASVGDFSLNTRYFAFLTNDVLDTSGAALVAPVGIRMAVQPHPVVGEDGASLVAQISDEQATAIAGVQSLLSPVVTAIEAAGVDHTDLVSVWTWSTWRDPFVFFDPVSADIPFPNAFLQGDDSKINLPTDGFDGAALAIVNELNARDGFSVLGDGWFTVTGEVDPASVSLFTRKPSTASVALARIQGFAPSLLQEDQIGLEYVPAYSKLMIRNKLPLQPNSLHAGIVSNRITATNGLAAQPTPFFVFISSKDPVYDPVEGNLIAQMPEGAGPLIEQARQTYAPLFTGAGLATNDDRDSIAAAFAFTTDDTAEPMQQVRARVAKRLEARVGGLTASRACEPDCTNDPSLILDPGAAYSSDFTGGTPVDMSNVARMQLAGEFSTVSVAADKDGASVLLPFEEMGDLPVGLSVYLPKGGMGDCAGITKFPVVIYQHGLGGSRQTPWALVNELAGQCLAVLSIDAPLHGGRAPGSMDLHPMTRPMNSGQGFLSADFVRTLHNFMQGISDLMVLTSLIESGQIDALLEQSDVLDTSKIGIIGISLGSIFSSGALAIDPRINVGVLNVPPGKLTYSLTEPSNVGAGLVTALEGLGITPGTFDFEQTLSLAQWVADPIDPSAMASYFQGDTVGVLEFFPNGRADQPMPNEPFYEVRKDAMDDEIRTPEAQVIVQMVRDDPTNPTIGAIQLAKTAGVSDDDFQKSVFDGPHGFLLGTTRDSDCARRQATAWLRSGLVSGTASFSDDLAAATCTAQQP